MDHFTEGLREASGHEVFLQEPMAAHTTFRVGGPADYFVIPSSLQALAKTVAYCRQEGKPFFILGNGSNLLVGDGGYRGVVIALKEGLHQVDVQGDCLRAQAGALLSRIAGRALEAGLEGVAFAAGIPGTLGGACVMNAGAYGGEMKQVLKEVTVLTPEGRQTRLDAEELELGYRRSNIPGRGYILLEALLQLRPGDPAAIRARMEELAVKRREKQPLEYPSAGSTFTRPEGHFAGKLIQDAGLRGFSVGGAQVSEKHCGFVINRDGATAADIVALMEQVQQRVWERFGVRLEPEVERIGEF